MTQNDFNEQVVTLLEMIWAEINVRNSYNEGVIESRIERLRDSFPKPEGYK